VTPLQRLGHEFSPGPTSRAKDEDAHTNPPGRAGLAEASPKSSMQSKSWHNFPSYNGILHRAHLQDSILAFPFR
jgi:hypothetical protein